MRRDDFHPAFICRDGINRYDGIFNRDGINRHDEMITVQLF